MCLLHFLIYVAVELLFPHSVPDVQKDLPTTVKVYVLALSATDFSKPVWMWLLWIPPPTY